MMDVKGPQLRVDDGKEHLASEICSIIEAHPSVTFSNISISGDLEVEYDTRIDEVTFENVRFLGRIEISGPKGSITFRRAVFEGEVSFYLSIADNLDFEMCQFQAAATFHSVETTSFWLNRSRFKDHSTFVNLKVKELLNLADVVFEASVDFSGAKIGEINVTRLRSSEPVQIRWSQFGEVWLKESYEWALAPREADERTSRLRQKESALRFWKQNFAILGQRTDELAVNYELVRLRRNYFTPKNGFRWWVSVLLEIPSRYGTRPFRPVLIGLLLILAFGVVYWAVDPFVAPKPDALPKEPLPLFSVFYSLDNFVPLVNITGVRDWGWVVSNGYRWVVLVERVLGLSVSILAAYSISQTVSLTED
jgi:hypothetical protein